MLNDIFELQRNLQINGFNFNYDISDYKKEEYARYFATRIVGEAYELMQELNIDYQTKGPKELDKTKIVLECVDIMKFLINILLLYDIPPESFFNQFVIKTTKNYAKIKKLNFNKGARK